MDKPTEEKCLFCSKTLPCYAHCQKTGDGVHVPDSTSIAPVHGMEFVVDINCKACGQSGSTRIEPTEIAWE